jgi:uncharacterized protein
MTYLLDINGVMALLDRNHPQHEAVHGFFQRRPFATCPLVQLGVLRLLTRPRLIKGAAFPPMAVPEEAWRKLVVLRNRRATVFITDELDAWSLHLPFQKVMGHRQWNDFYLVALAQRHHFKVATFDAGLGTLFPGHVTVISAEADHG